MKTVQLTENEVRCLCLKSREIFLSQPILLELEAPLKICGTYITLNFWLKYNLLFVVSQEITLPHWKSRLDVDIAHKNFSC